MFDHLTSEVRWALSATLGALILSSVLVRVFAAIKRQSDLTETRPQVLEAEFILDAFLEFETRETLFPLLVIGRSGRRGCARFAHDPSSSPGPYTPVLL